MPDPTQPGPVLVAGATGQTGRLIVAALQSAGLTVRALVRDPGKAAALPAGVTTVRGDVRDPATLAAALRGCASVVSAIGGRAPIGRNGFRAIDFEGNRNLIDAARMAGVERFIMITAASAGRAGFPYSFRFAPYPWKARAEAHLRASGLAWTVLGPGGLNDEPAGQKGVRATARRDYRTDWITRGDLALVTATCVGEPATVGRTIALVNDATLAVDGWRAALASLPAD